MSSQERTVITKPERLPRYRRAQRQGGFVLTARDLEILKTVQSYRLATSAHLQALVSGSDQHILRRLQKLFHAGHLDRLTPRPTYREGSAKMIYAITNNGFRELQKAGLIEEPTTTDWNDKNRRIQDLAINHTLLITHVRAVLECACRSARDLRVSFWKEGPQLYDATEVALDKGYERVPVAPDAFFGLKDAKARYHFFLEADRGTMTLQRFTRKLKAYAAYWHAKQHEEKFGIKYFRVLTVTTGAQREENLVEAARKEDDLKALTRFRFTHEGRLSLERPEGILENIWTNLADEEPHSLLD